MSFRTRKEYKLYKKHRKTFHKKTNCIFCDIKNNDEQFVRGTKHFKVIDNIFGYSLWDDQSVDDHLMIVPRKHIDTLSKLSPDESKEFVTLMSTYEKHGYNVWARAAQTKTKSVIHQHTHLIKPGKKTVRFMFYIRKPYFRLFK